MARRSTLWACISFFLVWPVAVVADDWPHWRGPYQNGVSYDTGLIESWEPRDGTNVAWKNDSLGTISTPIVMGGKLYALTRYDVHQPTEGERVVCVDALTGDLLWENRFNVFLSDVPAERVAWGNCAGDPETDRVYALGVCGYFQCLDAQTGKTVWSRSLSEEFGLLSTYGGRTNTPVIFEDLVIISSVTTGWDETARPAHRFFAFNKNDGQLVWISSTRPLPEDTTYSTPTMAVVQGQAMMVFGAGDGTVYAMQPRTGKIIWSYDFSRRGINSSPIVVGDRVYIGQSEENITGTEMGAVACIDATGQGDITKTGTIWKVEGITAGKSSPLLFNDRLYVVDDSAGLHVLDPSTGEELGRSQKLGTMMRSSLVAADGRIYACTASGMWFILEPTDTGAKIVHRLRLPSGNENQASPVIWQGRLYLATTQAMYCLADPNTTPGSQAVPPAPAESTVGDDPQPAWLQIVPAEAVLEPGKELPIEVRAFNARGQRVPTPEVQLSVKGKGEVVDGKLFRAAVGADHAAAILTAQSGPLTARSRIRLVPRLPWRFDFSDGQVPVTWIGANYRHIVRPVDGNPTLVKITTIPKGTRSQSWMGWTDLQNYTIQADVRGHIQDGKLPDMGLIAQRYTLDIQGESQQLQIRSWPPQLRMAKTIPFSWQPDTWYTVKFQSSTEDGKLMLRGKVWPKDQAEPQQWTIEATDPSPNLSGSPGLFGNATNAEIEIDNVQVW